jgi:hypothetical protein
MVRRKKMRRFLILLGAAIFIAGCSGMKPKKDTVDAFDYKYPKTVEWDKPDQVLKSFYGAKKRGDWQKAFEICDFDKVLPSEEAKQIREQWKKDSTNWKDRYLFRDYYVVEKERNNDTAIMLVTEFYISKDVPGDVAHDEYSEVMKKYGSRWKLVAALPKDEEAKKEKKGK